MYARYAPGYASMQRPAFQHPAQVRFCGFLLIGVDEREERLADEEVGLLLEMAGEDGVEVDEIEAGIEESPVCGEQASGI